jgi:hypothetical protein
MKPPETVTLIDLKGNIVVSFAEFTDSNSQDLINQHFTNLKMEEIDHFTDQLTFIRNGMWETLAIYQATLGRYWEVPVMEYEQATVDYLNRHNICHIVRRIETKISIPCNINNEDISVEQILKTTEDDRCILVTPSVYLEHYPDVFSRLRPWKGESTECY